MVFGNFRDVKRDPHERALFGQAEGRERKKCLLGFEKLT